MGERLVGTLSETKRKMSFGVIFWIDEKRIRKACESKSNDQEKIYF